MIGHLLFDTLKMTCLYNDVYGQLFHVFEMLGQFQFEICLFHVFKHRKLCGMTYSNVEMIIFQCDNIKIDIKSKKNFMKK